MTLNAERMTMIAIPRTEPAEKTGAERIANYQIVIDAAMFAWWAFLTVAASGSLLGLSRDSYDYVVFYESLPQSFSIFNTRFEPGFYVISWLFRNFFDLEFSTFILFVVGVALAIKFLLFRRYLAHPLLATVLYTAVFYPVHEYTQYRAALSLAFAYWAVHCLLQRKWLATTVLFLIACSMHYSSILIVGVALGGMFVRGRSAVWAIAVFTVIGVAIGGSLRTFVQDAFIALNPLSDSYLNNTALIEEVTLLSINNLLLIAAVICYIAAGYYSRSRYHAMVLTMTIAALVPIALLADAPVIAQRSKEVLFVAVVFLSCRSRLGLSDLPGFAFVSATAALLGYLAISGGVILT